MSERNKGIILLIISAACFACMNLCIRLAGDIPSVEKTFFRNFVALIVALFILKKKTISYKPDKKSGGFLVLRSLFGTIGMLCNFYAVDHIAIADASMLNKLSPFFVIIFSAIFLKERVKPYQVFFVVQAFIGTIFVVKPGGAESILPAIIGVIGGIGAGSAYTCVRKLSDYKVPGVYIVAFFSAFSCIVITPYIAFNFVMPDLKQFLLLMLTGIFASGGQFAITTAYLHAPGREISIYDYTQIIFAALLGFVFLGEIPDIFSFIGYAIIIAASGENLWMPGLRNKYVNVRGKYGK